MVQVESPWPCGDGALAGCIRAFDWAATPLGPMAAWSERLRLMVEQVLATPLVSSLVCGPERVLIYNDAAARLYGDRHPAALGRPLPKTFPEGWATVAPFYERAFAGETVQVAGQPLDTRGEGEANDVFDALLVPVHETDGRVAFVHMTGFEIGARMRVEAALRESEARHRLLIESWAQAVWETDAAGVVVTDSPSWRAHTGQTLDEWLGYGWLDAIHPDDRAYAERQWRAAVAVRRLVNAEFRLRAPDGGWRWTNVRAAPVFDAEGTIEKWAGMNVDIDARKRAEMARLESEAKLRTLFDTIDQGYCVSEVQLDGQGDVVDLIVREANRHWEAMTGLSDPLNRPVSELLPNLEDHWLKYYDEVFKTGRPVRQENYLADLDRWFSAHYSLTGELGSRLVAVVFDDITARKKAEAGLKESEELQVFLLALSDTLRPLTGARAIKAAACALLGGKLGASRAYFVEMDAATRTGFVHEDYTADGVASVEGRYDFDSFPATFERLREGATWAVPDVAAETTLPLAERAVFGSVAVIAWIDVPLLKDGHVEAVLCVTQTEPRAWTASDVLLVEETAERLWSAVRRGRVEVALRESEARFRQFAAAAAVGLWIRDAKTLTMEFVSPAVATIYGVEEGALLGDVTRWAALIVPEDREGALRHLEAARGGEVAVHEFRIQRPSDGAFRWIRNTGFPLRNDGDIPRIGGIAEDVTEAKLAVEHQGVLLAELQHRVRNIMAVIRAITARTGERAESVADYAEAIAGRLTTLARVQTLLTRAANAGVGLAGIVRDELGAKAPHERQYSLDGPDLALSPKAAEVLTLAIHELATNALKYGGLSVPDGHVAVRWATFEWRGTSWLGLDWIEEGAPHRPAPDSSAPRRRGFGLELIEGRIPYELGGRGTVEIGPGGARCRLEFPLRGGDSILETDAPQRATVFGGALDMTGNADLSGQRVLVIEDDFYLATDAARALQGAGAFVVGPCPNEEIARGELEEQRLDAAVVDINLGRGPSFALAEALKVRGIPFVFTTGYDQEVVPAGFEGVERLQKPFQLHQIVSAVAKLLGRADRPPSSGATEPSGDLGH